MYVIFISGIIGIEVTTDEIRDALNEHKGEEIRVEIASPGGYVYEGLVIYNLIKNHDGRVVTRLMGLAASMASIIALAGDYVEAERATIYMIHNAAGIFWGDYLALRAGADVLEGTSKLLGRIYADKTGKTADEIQLLMDKETYLFGDEMLAEGFVDTIIDGGENIARDEAVIAARLAITACHGKMKQIEHDNNNNKLAALLINPADDVAEKSMAAGELPDKTVETTNNDIKTEEFTIMTLAEIIAKHPELRAELDAKVKAGEDAGAQEVVDRIKAASAYLGKASKYPAAIAKVAIDCITGDQPMAVLQASVSACDMIREQNAENNAADETENVGETAATGPDQTADDGKGLIKSKEGLKAAAEAARDF